MALHNFIRIKQFWHGLIIELNCITVFFLHIFFFVNRTTYMYFNCRSLNTTISLADISAVPVLYIALFATAHCKWQNKADKLFDLNQFYNYNFMFVHMYMHILVYLMRIKLPSHFIFCWCGCGWLLF